MNRRLRKRHQLMLTGLALLLPIGFGLAPNARPAIPAGGGRVAALGPPAPTDGVLATQLTWWNLKLQTTVWPSTPERSIIVEMRADEDLALPDVLLYWSESGEVELQGDEFLLGSFFGQQTQRYALPFAKELTGRLILYSLAHDEVIGHTLLSGAEGDTWD